jgi:hypothetical protein
VNRYDAPPDAASQCGRILRLLESRRGEWVPLYEILNLKISQYGTRVKELRDNWGYAIENKTETANGQRHSWFRILSPLAGTKIENSKLAISGDWYEAQHGPRPAHAPDPAADLPLFSRGSR